MLPTSRDFYTIGVCYMLRRTFVVLAIGVGFASVVALAQPPAKPAGISFAVKIDPKQVGAKPE
jgi:hypothetical protein